MLSTGSTISRFGSQSLTGFFVLKFLSSYLPVTCVYVIEVELLCSQNVLNLLATFRSSRHDADLWFRSSEWCDAHYPWSVSCWCLLRVLLT